MVAMKSIRIGDFAIVFMWYPINLGYGVHKWSYFHESSWKHGSAWLWRLKVCW